MTKKHIRFDWAAKKILRDKKNFGILEGFLSELLDEFRAKGMSEVREKLNVMNLPEPERKKYDKFLERLHDEASYAETIKIEAEEAAKKVEDSFREDERNKEIALNCIKLGYEDDAILAITGMAKEELDAIKKAAKTK